MTGTILTKPNIERNFEAVLARDEVVTLDLDAIGLPRNGMISVSCNAYNLVGGAGFRASGVPALTELFNASSNFLVFHAPVLSFNNRLSVAASSTTLTSTLAGSFDNHDEGSAITVDGAGAGGADLATTIASVTSGTALELADPAQTTVSGADGAKALPPAPGGTTFAANTITISVGNRRIYFCNRFATPRTIRAQFL